MFILGKEFVLDKLQSEINQDTILFCQQSKHKRDTMYAQDRTLPAGYATEDCLTQVENEFPPFEIQV
jgi:hypothetical protein